MIHPETHQVTQENGPRPASPHKCMYCGSLIGVEHKAECVCRERTIVIRMTVEYVVSVVEAWTPAQIESHRNEGSWCSSNALRELEKIDQHGCLCGKSKFEYVREATEEDEEINFGSRDEGTPE